MASLSDDSPSLGLDSEKHSLQLPQEIILHILSFLPQHGSSQRSLWACCQVSRSWYSATVSRLYHSPSFTGRNYQLLLRTLCPSINAHVRKSALAEFVRVLDMSRLIHDGSKSLTARLLGRVKESLEEFIAPQSSFAVNCLTALSKCRNLKHLDLSLMCESLQVLDLMRALSTLSKLETFRFPRCSAANKPGMKDETIPGCKKSRWPDSLRTFYFSCGLQIGYLPAIIKSPRFLTSLTIEEGHSFSSEVVWCSVLTLGPQITSLTLEFGPKFGFEPMNALLRDFPHLTHLRMRTDHVSLPFFAPGVIPRAHPLKSLDVSATDEDALYALIPRYLAEAVKDGRLANLRTIGFSKMIEGRRAEDWEDDLMALAELLEQLEKKDREAGVSEDSTGESAGIWMFEGDSAIEHF